MLFQLQTRDHIVGLKFQKVVAYQSDIKIFSCYLLRHLRSLFHAEPNIKQEANTQSCYQFQILPQ